MKTKVIVGLTLVVALLATVRLGLFSPKATDQELIETALTEALKAAKEGRSGVVLDFISTQFTANTDFPLDRGQIARYIRENHPEVEVLNKKATISGDTAFIVSPVFASIRFQGMTMNHKFEDVKLTFKREDSLQWLIFPAKKWRLIEVVAEGLPEVDGWER